MTSLNWTHTNEMTEKPLMPHEYEMVWLLLIEGPFTAGEFAELRNRRRRDYQQEWTATGIANQLRSLVRRGWVVRIGGHYSASEAARRAVSW